MRIERLQVEGGFLDGLDLQFEPDLNVIIGGRGVGKTAVIELIRFCLAAKNLDTNLAGDSSAHAAGVLEDGVAHLTFYADGESRTVSRSVNSPPWNDHALVRTIVLSQREVETLGRTAQGRLNLIDSFLSNNQTAKLSQAQLKSLCVEIRDLCGELDELDEQLVDLSRVLDDLKNLRAQQNTLVGNDQARSLKVVAMTELQRKVNSIARSEHLLEEASENLRSWRQSLPARVNPLGEVLNVPGDLDILAEIRTQLASDVQVLSEVAGRVSNYELFIEREKHKLRDARVPFDDQVRLLRKQLEEEQAGAGRLAREISRLEESASRLQSLVQLRHSKISRLNAAQADRMNLLAEVQEERERVFKERLRVVGELNKALMPRVKVDLKFSSDVTSYEAAIIESLKGSYVRSSAIAPVLAQEVSPQELCRIVFERDHSLLGDILGIAEDRSSRLVSALRESNLERILLAPIGDEADFYLLDGASYKHVDELSIGQRCTAVLSVVLENTQVTLVIDQPEDHLDNEFIADSLIRAISNRQIMAQTIISTHNANIPVLCTADKVVQLDSNGVRGFVKAEGDLSDSEIVGAILSVMEGGRDAFDHRSNFYG